MTARNAIGGTLTYAALAQLHRPDDPKRLAAEIRRLQSDGLTPQDIATALRLPLDQVINTINPAGISKTSTACPYPRSAGVGGSSFRSGGTASGGGQTVVGDALPLGRSSLNDQRE